MTVINMADSGFWSDRDQPAEGGIDASKLHFRKQRRSAACRPILAELSFKRESTVPQSPGVK